MTPLPRCLVAVSLLALSAACGPGVRPSPASPSSPTAQPPIQPTPPARILNGQYEIRFEADASCSNLPEAVRVRRYMALVSGSSSTITLTGAEFGPPPPSQYHLNTLDMEGTDPDGTSGFFFQDPEVWELLTGGSYVSIFGDAEGVFDPDHTELVARGDFRFCSSREDGPYPECAVPEIVCRSDHHKVTLTRQ
jgi:hypothetical protein